MNGEFSQYFLIKYDFDNAIKTNSDNDKLEELKVSLLTNNIIEVLRHNPSIISNCNFDEIIELLKLSNFNSMLKCILNSLLIKLIPNIVNNYIKHFKATKKNEHIEFGINEFVKKLLYLDNTILAQIVMKEFAIILNNNNDYYLISQDIFTYDEYFGSHVIEEYIKILPNDFDMVETYSGIRQTIVNEFYQLKENELVNYVNEILTAGIILENNKFLNIIENILKQKSHYCLKDETYKILNELIKQI